MSKLSKVIQTWINDLRYGEYKQTKGMLKEAYDSNCYCCLGVLTEQYIKDTGDVYYHKDDESDWDTIYDVPDTEATHWFEDKSGGQLKMRDRIFVTELIKIEKFMKDTPLLNQDLHLLRKGYFAGQYVTVQSFLSDLNDHSFTFEQIALVIEYIYTELFPQPDVLS
jgi:hypothetical protein